ncbi:MAG TPA: dihydropteroate synthase [Vicinamibacterales bacterium]|nr:dihydropteroate synthase [Vicinamibacterales bacterium]
MSFYDLRKKTPEVFLRLPDRTLELGARTLVMGIVNVTPDSFADGGDRFDPGVAIADAIKMVESGADLLDIGGESTRPGAPPVPTEEELRRVTPVLEGLRGRVNVPISIDTYKAAVAERALDLGAVIVNDISALTYDRALSGVVARRRAGVVLMHNRGRSADMYARAEYADVVGEIVSELGDRIRDAEAAGIARDAIVVDPGLGFAKQAQHTFEALAHLSRLAELGRPILCGPSRKSFLRLALGDVPARERLWGSTAAVAASVLGGAHIVRVHDVSEMVQVVRVADRIRQS